MRWLAKLVNPNAARLTRLMRLLAASVAALVTRAACQLEIWVLQVAMVRPSRLISSGRPGSWRSAASWATVAAPTLAQGMS